MVVGRRDNNNIAWRNFDVVDVLADPSADPAIVPFAVVGAPDNQRVFDLLLLRDLPEGVEIWWEVPLGLYGLMRRAGFPKVSLRKRDEKARILLPDVREFVIRDVQLGSKAHFPTRLIVRGSKAMKDHLYRLAISQRTTGQEVGRVTVGMRGTVKRRASPKKPSPRS